MPAEYWGGKASGEAEVIFHKGYMVSGCIDKNQFGKFGLVSGDGMHACAHTEHTRAHTYTHMVSGCINKNQFGKFGLVSKRMLGGAPPPPPPPPPTHTHTWLNAPMRSRAFSIRCAHGCTVLRAHVCLGGVCVYVCVCVCTQVHAIQEMYGGATAGHLLSAFSRLFTAYLQSHGFTCGFDDLLLNETVEEKRKVGWYTVTQAPVRTKCACGIRLAFHGAPMAS